MKYKLNLIYFIIKNRRTGNFEPKERRTMKALTCLIDHETSPSGRPRSAGPFWNTHGDYHNKIHALTRRILKFWPFLLLTFPKLRYIWSVKSPHDALYSVKNYWAAQEKRCSEFGRTHTNNFWITTKKINRCRCSRPLGLPSGIKMVAPYA